jgi:hypothetical protein
MDTETIMMLAQLLSQAKGGNKNVSSIGNNLTDPVILALAGVLDPYYGMGENGSGVLYNQFASDSSTPAAVRAVMDYIDQGMNSYQVEAQINALDPDVITNSGYTTEQLISMGKEMSDERSKAKGSNVFTKAGLRNPNEVYTPGDVPLSEKEQKLYSGFLKSSKESEKKLGSADYAYRSAQKNLSDKTKTSKDINAEADELVADMPFVSTQFDAQNRKAAREILKEKYSKTPATQKDFDDVSRAMWRRANIQNQKRYDEMRAEAVQEGAFNRAAKSGRTPFTDQTSALLQFIAGTK